MRGDNNQALDIAKQQGQRAAVTSLSRLGYWPVADPSIKKGLVHTVSKLYQKRIKTYQTTVSAPVSKCIKTVLIRFDTVLIRFDT